jgi:hypothetical protein
MLNEDWKNEKIKLNDLSLWDENSRFPDKYFGKDEKELISYFCSLDFLKIFEFAKEIAKDFDLPQLEKFVVLSNEKGNIVLEGNRRLVAYKLLNNPNLISDKKLKEKFVTLKSTIELNENFEIECLITSKIEEGYRYIERKHLTSNNEISWKDNERAHYRSRRGKANQQEKFKVAITEIIRTLDIPENMKDSILGQGHVTNFWRIINSSPAWEEYGFSIEKNGNLTIKDKEFTQKLKVIIMNVLQKKNFLGERIDSRSLNTTKEKEKYIKSITEKDYPKVETELKKQEKETLTYYDSPKKEDNFIKREKITPKSTLRSYLISKDCYLKIDPKTPKINNIFRELRDDLLIDDSNKAVPNAVGVLFRVFLEISIDYFLENKGYTVTKDDKIPTKIFKITEYMEKNKIATSKQLVNIRAVATDKNNLLSIENFHSYVHSYKSQPTPCDLKLKWDNLREFFEILYREISEKENKK